MLIDINNNNKNIINEKYSISPILNTYQSTNSNLLFNNLNNNLKNNPLFTSWSTNKFYKEKEKEKNQLSSNSNLKFFLPEINTQSKINNLKKNLKKNNNINNNIDNQSTKKKKKKNSNNTEEYSKDRIDLMSAQFISNINSTSNNIIPMISLKRPNSNFNLGGNLLWEKMENFNSNNILNTEIIEKNNFHSRNNNNNIIIERGKVSTAPLVNNNIKLHKIKIEKGINQINKIKNFESNEYYDILYNKNIKNSFKNINKILPLKIKREKH